MKIIYEKGDIVNLDDDIYVPYELANIEVELIKKLDNHKWIIEDDNGKKYVMEERWFSRYVSSIYN